MKTALMFSTLLAIASIGAWTTAVPTPAIKSLEIQPAARPVPRVDTTALAKTAARIRTRNAFRIDRRPADVLYNPWEPSAPPAPPVTPRALPRLALAGILGPPWNALIEGVPGRETGLLLAVGEERSGVKFVALRGDTVLLSGFDTTWTLTARRAWQR
jgi:hypothetical protein